jgi:hypothetical protein
VIDKIYIIWHVERHKDNLIKKIGEFLPNIPYELIKGPDGSEIFDMSGYKPVENWKQSEGSNPPTYKEYTVDRWNEMAVGDGVFRGRDHKLGELACGIAHHRAWKRAKEDGVKKALFLEQDAFLNWEDENRVAQGNMLSVKLKNNLDKLEYYNIDYDMLYVGHDYMATDKESFIKEEKWCSPLDYDWVVKSNFIYMLHAYIVTDKGLGVILDNDYENNLCVADEWLPALYAPEGNSLVHPSLSHLHGQLKSYALIPCLIEQIDKDFSHSGTEFSDYYEE